MTDTKDWQRRYAEHIKSAQWRNTRKDILRMRGSACERCGRAGSARDLDVHHKTYERLGRERASDLEVLCRPCHREADRIRADAARQRSERAYYDARLEGWASKAFGPDWYERDPEYVERLLRRVEDREY